MKKILNIIKTKSFKLVALLLALLLMASIVACAPDNDKDNGGGTTTQTPSTGNPGDGSTDAFDGEWISLPIDTN